MLSSRAGLSAGHCTLLECKAVTTRLAKLSGLGLASRPAYSSLRREAAALAAYRRARLGGSSLGLPGIVPVCYIHVGPPATDSYGFMYMVRCERYSSRMTTRLAKLSGLGLASRPAHSSLRREAAAQAAYRRARRLLQCP